MPPPPRMACGMLRRPVMRNHRGAPNHASTHHSCVYRKVTSAGMNPASTLSVLEMGVLRREKPSQRGRIFSVRSARRPLFSSPPMPPIVMTLPSSPIWVMPEMARHSLVQRSPKCPNPQMRRKRGPSQRMKDE